MKKIIIILLLSLIPLLPSSGQMVVTDPAHTAANVVGHAMSLTEAIEQGLGIVSQLSTLKQVYDQMKAIKEKVEKVSEYIYQLQSIIDAMSRLVNIIQRTSDIYRSSVRSNTFTVDELMDFMDYLTEIVQTATNSANQIKDYISSGKWKFTDKERKDAIESSESEMEGVEESLENTAEYMDLVSSVRKKIDDMYAKGMFTPMEAYAAGVTGKIRLGEEFRFALLTAFDYTDTAAETDTATTAARKTTLLYDNLKTLFFVLSGFIALIGAFRVYRKINLEEDGLGKAVAIWFTSALTVFILGSIVELFMF
jgi:archaellum component FlaC